MTPTDLASRQAVLAAACTWLGTPYRHRARLQGVGVDCAQLLVAVYSAAGLVPAVDLGDYPIDWHLHQDEERFLGWLHELGARRVPDGQPAQAGDVAVFRFGRCFSHGGIVEDPATEGGATIIHSYIRRRVMRHRLCEAPLQGVPLQYWTLWPQLGAQA